jgi:hypothetical protein
MSRRDAGRERVGAAMHQAPFGAVSPVDERDTQRPVLRRQAAGFHVRSLDRREHDHVGGRGYVEADIGPPI